MLRPLATCLIAVAVALGPADLLQMLAWSGMLIERVPDRGWASAVRSTFDGSAPCSLCRQVDTLRERGPRDDGPAAAQQVRDWPSVIAAPVRPCLLVASGVRLTPPVPIRRQCGASRAPPRPVPR